MHPRLELGIFCTENIRDSRCSTATVRPAAKYLYIYSRFGEPRAVSYEPKQIPGLHYVTQQVGRIERAHVQQWYSDLIENAIKTIIPKYVSIPPGRHGTILDIFNRFIPFLKIRFFFTTKQPVNLRTRVQSGLFSDGAFSHRRVVDDLAR
ncbi:hypothetical protein EVAR_78576_1 [Eumeta japonica]|uniref:Uncharacterized protein n=1 Tax=Eumeta variegata TaxID=151549 RepID=A0A4C1W777_EUMVA|nr:hypothetical protein EVAR_78576_1 [Eumeta japonica]